VRERSHFQAFGFVLLRDAFDPEPVRVELLRALPRTRTATGVASVQYAPMMSALCKASLDLLDRLETTASALLGGPVLPVRAKGMRYFGSTGWHADSTRDVASVGFAAYLSPLARESGALRVLPGSHRGELGLQTAAYLAQLGSAAGAVDALPGVALETRPGDIIAFDEHLFHASAGGDERLQWRVDFVRAPTSPAEQDAVRAYFCGLFPPDWDGGYDVDHYPSYGEHWLASGRAAVRELRDLGVYELAARQEAFMRAEASSRESGRAK
jgi:hypothetical protein